MNQEAVNVLLSSLLRKSEAGQVNWIDSGTAGEDQVLDEDYYVILPEATINIFKSQEDEIRLNIINSGGDVIMYIDSKNDTNLATILERLLRSAKSKVLNVDGTLEYLIKSLSTDGIVGSKSSSKVYRDDY